MVNAKKQLLGQRRIMLNIWPKPTSILGNNRMECWNWTTQQFMCFVIHHVGWLMNYSHPRLFFYLRTNCSCGLVHATISWTKAMANKLPSCCKYIRIVTAKNEFHPQNNTHERWMQPEYRNNASTTNRLVGKKFTRTLIWFRSAYCFDRFLFRSKCDVRGICMPYGIYDARGP